MKSFHIPGRILCSGGIAALLFFASPATAVDLSEYWYRQGVEQVTKSLNATPVGHARAKKLRGYRYTVYAHPKTGHLQYLTLFYHDRCIGLTILVKGRIPDAFTAQILENYRGDSSWRSLGVERSRGQAEDGSPYEYTFTSWHRKDRKLYAGILWQSGPGENYEISLILIGDSRATRVTPKLKEEMIALVNEAGLKMLNKTKGR